VRFALIGVDDLAIGDTALEAVSVPQRFHFHPRAFQF
jgi:hypothetical protein